jgi:hypothetical protein
MIVRNESAIIERCLASVLPVIDYWVILDTGSTDDTADRIQAFFRQHALPGELHHAAFVDFSTTRNRALELCRASEQGFDYILLIDADMQLVVQDAAALQRLEADACSIEQRNALAYHNVRLVRRSLAARYRGVTHEYLDTGSPPQPLAGVYMLDHACGANRVGKFERDIRLLERGLEQEPDNLRYRFYLAQSLRDAGKPAAALPHYLARSTAGGWEEEAWYAAYQAASCMLDSGDKAGFEAAARACVLRRPHRAEPLALLARYYRDQGRYEEACATAVQGRELPFPDTDRLFVERAVYYWVFDQELAICGYYTQSARYRQLGKACCEQLALSLSVPAGIREQARRNLVYYAPTAGQLLELTGAKELAPPAPAGWACSNPSVWVHQQAPAVLVRQVNYTLKQGRYTIQDASGVIRTRNVLLTPGKEGGLAYTQAIPEAVSGSERKHYDFPVRGFEDGRLFRWQGRWCATATVRDSRADGRCEMALLEINPDGSIARETLLRGPWSDEDQKNWMPLVVGGDLLLVYSLSPTRLLRVDPQTRQARPFAHSETPVEAGHLRGGSQLVRVKHPALDGWLGVCHDVQWLAPDSRHYLHRLFALDKEFLLCAFSDTFTFSGAAIEFCAGLALDGAQLLVSYGVNDGKAMLARLPLDNAVAELRPLAVHSG